jgi:hypothetical protein
MQEEGCIWRAHPPSQKGDLFPVAPGRQTQSLTRRVCQGSGSAHRNVMEMESVWLILCVFMVLENSW